MIEQVTHENDKIFQILQNNHINSYQFSTIKTKTASIRFCRSDKFLEIFARFVETRCSVLCQNIEADLFLIFAFMFSRKSCFSNLIDIFRNIQFGSKYPKNECSKKVKFHKIQTDSKRKFSLHTLLLNLLYVKFIDCSKGNNNHYNRILESKTLKIEMATCYSLTVNRFCLYELKIPKKLDFYSLFETPQFY